MFKNIFKRKQVISARSVLDLRDYTPEALREIKSIEAVATLILPENPSPEFMEAFSKIHLEASDYYKKLSKCEKRIVELKIEGYNSTEIGKKLNISASTVRTYLEKIRNKLK